MLDYTKFTTEDLSSIDNKNSEIIPWKINEILEDKYLVFWKNLTIKQEDMIDSWSQEFIEKIKWVLKFNKFTTSIIVDWKKYIFPNIQPIFNTYPKEYEYWYPLYKDWKLIINSNWKENNWWDKQLKKVKEIWKEWLHYKELLSIFELIEWKIEILGLKNNIYWSKDTFWHEKNTAWFVGSEWSNFTTWWAQKDIYWINMLVCNKICEV